MTESVRQALAILRSADHFAWYLIPLVAFVIYVYTVEVQARRWHVVLAGLIFAAAEFGWEIGNALLVPLTGYSALWVTPGDTAYLILVGLNIEICLMFSVAGVILVKLLPADRETKILGVSSRIFVPIVLGLFCVGVESLLNAWDALIWDYWFWSWPHLYLLGIGYCAPFLILAQVYDRVSLRGKAIALAVLAGADVLLWLVFVTWLKWI